MDISPDNFVSLVLPVYKAMFAYMESKLPAHEAIRSVAMLKHYTSVSFGRLLVLAEHKLRLSQAHFEAALEAIAGNSDHALAPHLKQEQVSCCQLNSTLALSLELHTYVYACLWKKYHFQSNV